MTKTKSASYVFIRTLTFGMGLTFPFISSLWKIVVLVAFLVFRVVDIEGEKKITGVTSLFFIGMIIAFTYKLFWP